MNKKYNKFLILSLTLVSIYGVYFYFIKDIKIEASGIGILASSLNSINNAGTINTNSNATEDTAFLMKLASLTRIKIDTSLFVDQSFRLLIDNNIKLEPALYGRTNPFSSIENPNQSVKQVVSLKAILPTLITNKSAVLNGSIEGASSNNIYFEYGTTESLGKTTQKVIPSLAGNFSSTISTLNPKTQYFFRVVANINGALSYSEIISFNTN